MLDVSSLRFLRSMPSRFGVDRHPAGLALLYHRVAALPSDPQRLATSPARFAEHLELLRRRCHPLPLRDMIRRAIDGTLPERAVALTFDDGYVDCLSVRAVLEEHEIPATIFVTTPRDQLDQAFWWDEIERLILGAGTLPGELTIRIEAQEWRWRVDTTAGSANGRIEDAAGWHVERRDDPSPRHTVYRSLCAIVKGISNGGRREVLRQLASQVTGAPAARDADRRLTRDEIAGLARSRFVDIGAHTVTHSQLSALPLPQQKFEIEESRRCLQDTIGGEIGSFAYPFGQRSDYSAATARLVRSAGYQLACAASFGRVDRRCDPFQVPRAAVGDWDADRFESQIESWFGPAGRARIGQ